MFNQELELFSNAAQSKYNSASKQPLKFLVGAIIAGFFIVVATMLSNVTAALFYAKAPELGKFISSVIFSIAIILVVFIGGELFTGNNMVMALGLYNRKVSFGNTMKVWLYSYIGNLIGTVLLSLLFLLSGCAKESLTNYFDAVISGKLDLSILQLFVRGILCNYLVCMAVFIGKRMTSESGKLIVILFIITTFVICGFEHSIANMSTFTLAGVLLNGLPVKQVILNFIFVTLGNIVGGALLFAWPLQFVGKQQNEQAKKNESAD